MYRTQEIIENQGKFKSEILFFFLSEINEAKKELRGINSEDEFIVKEKEKLLKRFKKNNSLDSIKKYFFLSNKRDENFYVWWDEKQNEALILKYDQK